MNKKAFFLLAAVAALSYSFMTAQEKAAPNSWQGWVQQATGSVTANNISQFKAKLPNAHQTSFDSAGTGTQSLAVVIREGLVASDPDMQDSYALAYKIANKAEVGYYMDQVKKRLNY